MAGLQDGRSVNLIHKSDGNNDGQTANDDSTLMMSIISIAFYFVFFMSRTAVISIHSVCTEHAKK